MSERQFPILYQGAELRACRKYGPATVPWSLLAPHETQARRNHSQTLEELANRGGLSPKEIMCVVEDRSWRPEIETETQALQRPIALL